MIHVRNSDPRFEMDIEEEEDGSSKVDQVDTDDIADIGKWGFWRHLPLSLISSNDLL